MPAIVKAWIERLEPRVGMAGNPRMAFLAPVGGTSVTSDPISLLRGADGIAFDALGNLWATMIFADRLVAITPEGPWRYADLTFDPRDGRLYAVRETHDAAAPADNPGGLSATGT